MREIIRVAGVFVKLDMPDPRKNWRRMAADIGFLVLFLAAFLLALWAL
jgi:hypothetical protein